MAEIDDRKQRILRAIIIEYIQSAEPIASDIIAQKYELGVKSATVRNEMADLSELGLIEQPHTSAGRIPSDLGYRYFVDRLIDAAPPSEKTVKVVQQTTDEREALQPLLQDTVRLLSRVTQQFSAAATIRDRKLSIRTAMLSALGPKQAIFVVVLSNGHVENRLIEIPDGLSLDDLGRTNERLSTTIAGKTMSQFLKLKTPTGGGAVVDKLIANLWSALKLIANQTTEGLVVSNGEEYIVGKPEFQRDFQELSRILNELSRPASLYGALADESNPPVTIGKENRTEVLQRLSIIRKSFFIGGEEAGLIAIIGPTRLDYQQNIPLVELTAQALTSSLTKFFGNP